MTRVAAAAAALVLLALGYVSVPALSSGVANPGTCTAAKHASNVKALNAFKKKMPRARAAYFRSHRNPKQRATFVKRQAKQLALLKKAAACLAGIAVLARGSRSPVRGSSWRHD